MSWQATLWTANLPHSRVGHVPFRVLMLLADHAHEDGTSAWFHVEVIADKLEVSQRTVYRGLAALKEGGLIREGDQRLVSHIPENKRPKVYDLNVNGIFDAKDTPAPAPAELEPEAPAPAPAKDLLDPEHCRVNIGHSRGVGLMAGFCKHCHTELPLLRRVAS